MGSIGRLFVSTADEVSLIASPHQYRVAFAGEEPSAAGPAKTSFRSFHERDEAIPFEKEMGGNARGGQNLNVCSGQALELFNHARENYIL